MCILYWVWITALSFEIDVLDRKQKWEFSLLVARLKSFIWLLSSFHTMQKAVYFISLSLGFLGINRLVIFFARKVCKWLFKALLHLPCEVYHIAVLPKKEFWWECVFWLHFTEFLARQETGTTGRCCKHCSVCVCVCVCSHSSNLYCNFLSQILHLSHSSTMSFRHEENKYISFCDEGKHYLCSVQKQPWQWLERVGLVPAFLACNLKL